MFDDQTIANAGYEDNGDIRSIVHPKKSIKDIKISKKQAFAKIGLTINNEKLNGYEGCPKEVSSSHLRPSQL
jgi:hypothetical protein